MGEKAFGKFVLSALALMASTFFVTQAFAIGALAADPSGRGWGSSWGYATKGEAAQSAISSCAGSCNVVLYFSGGCGAYAVDRNVRNSAAAMKAQSKRGAEQRALQACQGKGGAKCRVVVSACE